jgi:hypothetical protein
MVQDAIHVILVAANQLSKRLPMGASRLLAEGNQLDS